MQFLPIDNFGFTTGTVPAGDFVAAGIAASSDVDCCKVGSHRLGPMGLVPCFAGAQITPMRGYRTGSVAVLGGGPPRVQSQLVLMLFERGDIIFQPGPRAPYIDQARLPAMGANAAAATLALRAPFFGRSSAVVCASRLGGDTTDATMVIRGVRYHAYPVPGALTDQGFITETTQALWEGNAAQPVSVLTTGTDKLLGVANIGGEGDFEESFDELEVWVYGAAGGTPGIHVQIEVTGERGR